MDENRKPETISFYEHEQEIARTETHSRRWMIAALIIFIALIGTNLGWIIHESMYQDVVTETYTAESDDGGVSISNGTGTVNYGSEGKLQQDEDAR